MRYSKLIHGFFLDSDIHGEAPADAVTISDALYNALLLGQSRGMCIVPDTDGMPVLKAPVQSQSQLLQTIVISMDSFIIENISRLPYNYSSVEELKMWLDDVIFKDEATTLLAWCMACYGIQNDIVSGAVTVTTVTDAINMLPPFPFT